MGVVDGFVAAAASPVVMTIGFYLWDKVWTGSGLLLNALKGVVAAAMFAVVLAGLLACGHEEFWPRDLPRSDVLSLWISSILGIVLGDTIWLAALGRIGARRVILIDATKPFMAAVVAAFILQEVPSWKVILGMFITGVGVLVVALNRSEQPSGRKAEAKAEAQEPTVVESQASSCKISDGETSIGEEEASAAGHVIDVDLAAPDSGNSAPEVIDSSPGAPETSAKLLSPSALLIGYGLAVLNCALEVVGLVLVKSGGQSLNTWQINMFRFGSAGLEIGVCLTAVAVASKGLGRPVPDWCVFPKDLGPSSPTMRQGWLLLMLGITFVTFAAPALSQYAIFEIQVAVFMTITSTGPVWALPIGFLVKRERPSLRAVVGSSMVVAGVIPLAFAQA